MTYDKIVDIITAITVKGRIAVGKKKVLLAFIAALLVLAFETVDVFYVHSTGSLFASNVVSRFVSIAVVIIFSLAVKSNIKKLCFRTYNWFFELFKGFLLAAIPAGAVFAAEYGLMILLGMSPGISISFPNTNDGMSMKGRLFAIGVFALTVLLQSVFKELVFRGYLITQLFEKFGIGKANTIQAIFYTLLLCPRIANMILTGRFTGYGWQMTAFIIGCNLLVDFMSGIKWGLYFRVSGSVWMSTADHFANNIILTCLSVYSGMPMKWFVIQAVAVQTLSLIMFVPIYFRRDRLNEEIAAEVAIQRELAGMTVDNYSPSPVRHFIEDRYRVKQEENARKRNMPMPADTRIRFPSDFEEPVSIADMKLVAEEEFIKTVNNDGAESTPEEDDSIEKMTSSPSEMSKKYFDNVVEKSSKTDVDITAGMNEGDAKEAHSVSENDEKSGQAENISKLVQGYFNENFNKHTFQHSNGAGDNGKKE